MSNNSFASCHIQSHLFLRGSLQAHQTLCSLGHAQWRRNRPEQNMIENVFFEKVSNQVWLPTPSSKEQQHFALETQRKTKAQVSQCKTAVMCLMHTIQNLCCWCVSCSNNIALKQQLPPDNSLDSSGNSELVQD